MATTKIWSVHGRIGDVIGYAENPDKTANPNYTPADLQALRDVMNYAMNDFKTERQYFVSGLNCIPEIARDQMTLTKRRFGKERGIVAFHAYQSFTPGEVTPEEAHRIGIELAKKLWGERFEVIVATHLNTHCCHNHFVLNSVSFVDGKKFNDCKAFYETMRQASDELCLSHGLSVIKEPQTSRARYDTVQAEKRGEPTMYNLIRADVDAAVRRNFLIRTFIADLRGMGYEVKDCGKYLAVRPQGRPRFVRLKTLGEAYTEEAICERMRKNRTLERPQNHMLKTQPTRYHLQGSFKSVRKATGLRALYFHYCYLLGVFHKGEPPHKLSFAMRQELRKLDSISAQAKLLARNHIDSTEQLAALKSDRTERLTELTSQRMAIAYRLRRCKEEQEIEELKSRRAALTAEISACRRELKHTEQIEVRSEQMRTNLHEQDAEKASEQRAKQKRKEMVR